MRLLPVFLTFALCSPLAADDLEKTQKKDFEAQVKIMTAEAQRLEKAGSSRKRAASTPNHRR